MRHLIVLLVTFSSLQSLQVAASDSPVDVADVRKCVERSLAYVEKGGVGWMENRHCISCHHVGFMVWAHNAAREKGFAVDAKKLSEWTEWTVKHSLDMRTSFKLSQDAVDVQVKSGLAADLAQKLKPIVDKPFVTESEFADAVGKVLTLEELETQKGMLVRVATQQTKEGLNDGGGPAVIFQLMVGVPADASRMSEWISAMSPVLERFQGKDGLWKASGQFPSENRTVLESNYIMTGWNILGLSSKFEKTDVPTQKMISQALAKFRTMKPEKSTESRVVAFLVERQFGTAETSAPFRDALLKQQNVDGGWGWLIGGASDSFATGQVLYALGSDGLTVNDAVVQKALRFLNNTQEAEGGWFIPGPAIAATDTKPDRIKRLETLIYRHWGASWAVIGMTRVLPK